MRFVTVISVLAGAATIGASPVDPDVDMRDTAGIQTFKRDAPLTPRDLELAELHGVNITEMYKHSVVKRDDGDDITIWIDNSYYEEPDDEQGASEKRGLKVIGNWDAGYKRNLCGYWTGWHGSTGTNSPTTGGPQELFRWALAQSRGAWHLPHNENTVALVVAGSNGGANARIDVKRTYGNLKYGQPVGVHDVAYIADQSLRRWQRKISGKWRVSGRGEMKCPINNTKDCKSDGKNPANGTKCSRSTVHWQLTKSDLRA